MTIIDPLIIALIIAATFVIIYQSYHIVCEHHAMTFEALAPPRRQPGRVPRDGRQQQKVLLASLNEPEIAA